VEDGSRRKKRSGPAEARRSAVKDAMPDVQRPGQIKRVREEDEEPVAENDEEDD